MKPIGATFSSPPPSPNLLFRPRRIVLPLDVALEFSFKGDPLIDFIRERIVSGDPGPLVIVDGVATTPVWDLEIARTGLCMVLRKKSGLEVTSGEVESEHRGDFK